MIIEEKIQVEGNSCIRRYSDKHYYIKRDDIMYDEAIDLYELKDERVYTETDIPIEDEEELKLASDSDEKSIDGKGGDQ